MKTLTFAGFKIKVLTCRLLPPTKIYAFASPRHAKEFVAILESFDTIIKGAFIKGGGVKLVVRKPKGRIIRP